MEKKKDGVEQDQIAKGRERAGRASSNVSPPCAVEKNKKQKSKPIAYQIKKNNQKGIGKNVTHLTANHESTRFDCLTFTPLRRKSLPK